MTAASGSGTLPEPQVRAMFDRIARVYDRMNSVMTAGMHHRWRRRAADLARVAPATPSWTWPPGRATWPWSCRAASGPPAGWWGPTSPRACWSWRAGRRPRSASRPATPWSCRIADGKFDASDGGLRRAQLRRPASRGLAEMARVVRPGGRVVVLEITTPQRPPLSWFFRLWFDRVVPALGRAGRRRRRLHLPAQLGAPLPGPRELGAELARAGLVDVRWVLTAGGIIAIHAGTVPPRAVSTAAAPGIRAGCGRARAGRLAGRYRGAAAGDRRAATAPSSAGHASGTLAAGGKRLRPVLVFLCGGDGRPAWRRPPWRWSCCTWPRSCTTTCWTRRRLRRGRPTVFAAGGPRGRHVHRRPAVLARVRRASGHRQRRRRPRPLARLLGSLRAAS